MTTDTHIPFAEIPATYAKLVALHPPRVIRDKTDLENTTAIIDALAGHKLTRDQDDYLELLSQLVETYENENVPEPKPAPPLETLKVLLSENDLNGDDLATILGVDRSQAYKILKGTRKLTLDHVRKLAKRFRVDVKLFA